jgi:hypothetical protein
MNDSVLSLLVIIVGGTVTAIGLVYIFAANKRQRKEARA